MKKLLFTFTFLVAVVLSQAQTMINKRYTPTYSTGSTYVPLSASATQIPFPVDWDDEISDNIPMPFNFKYQNVTISEIAVETYGTLILNGLYQEYFEFGSILGINMDYESKNRGEVFYETSGTNGNRIFKVEFRNVGRYNDIVGNDTLNFQIWLYENGNTIEYRAGYSNVQDSLFAKDSQDIINNKEMLAVGLFTNNGDSISTRTSNLALHSVKLNAATITDTIQSLTNIQNFELAAMQEMLFEAYPPSGSIIRFTPIVGVGINKVDFDMATIYPNPSKNGYFNLQLKDNLNNAKIAVYDITGKIIYQGAISGSSATIDLSKFAAGNYVGKITNENRVGVFQLIKE